jgi:hypothetical protein
VNEKRKVISEKQAYSRMARLCSQKEYCSYDISQKLYRLNLNAEDIERVVNRLIKENFINDERYTRSYIGDKIKFNKWGRIKIELALRQKKIPVELVFQEFDKLPEGFKPNPERVKPWGTNHAVMMGKDVINEPFAVINADDFYGRESFKILADTLSELNNSENNYCMIGYRIGNTLSESGTVARGVCETDENGYLTGVVERTQVKRINGEVCFKDENDQWIAVEDNTPVSMNMWGFTPDYFKYSDDYFVKFLEDNQDNIKAEFFIPLLVNHLIVNKTAKVRVLDTPSKWFGVTYAEDRPDVVAKLKELSDNGTYPTPLW